ncbi:MAG: lipid-A-disaccharide synthase-related protein [Almyronema sp.]
MTQRLLSLSNGHGEDLNASLILRSLQTLMPTLTVAAIPLVGRGKAYRRTGITTLGPIASLPSGGLIYTHPFNYLKDLWGGLICLTLQQFRAVRRYSRTCHLLLATGDVVPILMAYLSGQPYTAFLVSTSSFYEGRLRLPLITRLCLRSRRCLQIFTRDAYTAADLNRQGMTKAMFVGYPIMDVLAPTGRDLGLNPAVPMIALLPGSRLPEALENLKLQLQLCEQVQQLQKTQFCAALVPSIGEADLQAIAAALAWQYTPGKLTKSLSTETAVEVYCYPDAFADILHQCTLAIGMAGTAVEQAVGLGKPVIQIPGQGPQFTYQFAEAQMRLLGRSVQTIGRRPANSAILQTAAQRIVATLQDFNYLSDCPANGTQRVGKAGGSEAIAQHLQALLKTL